MRMKIQPLFSDKEERMSVITYEKMFPLKLSDKNTLVDIYVEREDDVETMQTLAYFISQSRMALVVLHMAEVNIGGQLTIKGEVLLDSFKTEINKYHYQYTGGIKERVWVFGMFRPGLVYTE